MKCVLITENSPDFLIVGLGLTAVEDSYVGKVGRNEIHLLPSYETLEAVEGDVIFINIGEPVENNNFRPGDILMSGSDELIDRAFQALDDMEQRGVVVSLSGSSDLNMTDIVKVNIHEKMLEWKTDKTPFICLCMAGPVDSEGLAKIVTLIRRIMS